MKTNEKMILELNEAVVQLKERLNERMFEMKKMYENDIRGLENLKDQLLSEVNYLRGVADTCERKEMDWDPQKKPQRGHVFYPGGTRKELFG